MPSCPYSRAGVPRQIAHRVSTGLGALDEVLEGLYWGDNVVWQLDGAPVDPFYGSDSRTGREFEGRTFDRDRRPRFAAGVRDGAADAARGAGDELGPSAICCERCTGCAGPGEPSAAAVRFAGQHGGVRGDERRARVLRPVLSDAARSRGDRVLVDERAARRRPRCSTRSESVTQCVVPWTIGISVSPRPRAQRGRSRSGAPLASELTTGRSCRRPTSPAGSAASLRAVRRARALSQQELAGLAGVTASAISQAERAERGLSLGTLAQLSSRARDHDRRSAARRRARRVPDRTANRQPAAPADEPIGWAARRRERPRSASTSCSSDRARSRRQAAETREGAGIVAVASGSRAGPCRRSDARRSAPARCSSPPPISVDGWRNMGQTGGGAVLDRSGADVRRAGPLTARAADGTGR